MLWRRPDGKPALAPPYRRLMPLLMRGRNEAAVYFDLPLDVERSEAFLVGFNAAHPETPATLFHLVVWALARTLHERPRLNRFVAGGRLWDRDGVVISYAAKQRRGSEESPLVVLRRRFDPQSSFASTVAAMHADLARGRSGEKTASDREQSCLLALPGCGARLALGLVAWLDAWGLLPRAVLETDPFHASVFVANLGSLKMDAAYHHLYEWGTCPIFCTVGQVREEPVVRDGALAVGRRALLRFQQPSQDHAPDLGRLRVRRS